MTDEESTLAGYAMMNRGDQTVRLKISKNIFSRLKGTESHGDTFVELKIDLFRIDSLMRGKREWASLDTIGPLLAVPQDDA